MRLLIVGDSSAAGVGVATQSQALSGQMVSRLSRTYDVTWQLVARTGETARSTRKRLAQVTGPFDAVVLALGVNDAKNGVSVRSWVREYAEILQDLEGRLGARRIYVAGVPPLGAFPLLPWPLSAVLAARATALETALASLCRANPRVAHMPFDMPIDPALMAEDGFHPGKDVYEVWAERVVLAVKSDFVSTR